MYATTTKQAIAIAYSPNFTTRSALNRLSRWIKGCPPLVKALRKTGYFDTSKKITGRQKWLIYRYLGPPNHP